MPALQTLPCPALSPPLAAVFALVNFGVNFSYTKKILSP